MEYGEGSEPTEDDGGGGARKKVEQLPTIRLGDVETRLQSSVGPIRGGAKAQARGFLINLIHVAPGVSTNQCCQLLSKILLYFT